MYPHSSVKEKTTILEFLLDRSQSFLNFYVHFIIRINELNQFRLTVDN